MVNVYLSLYFPPEGVSGLCGCVRPSAKARMEAHVYPSVCISFSVDDH